MKTDFQNVIFAAANITTRPGKINRLGHSLPFIAKKLRGIAVAASVIASGITPAMAHAANIAHETASASVTSTAPVLRHAHAMRPTHEQTHNIIQFTFTPNGPKS